MGASGALRMGNNHGLRVQSLPYLCKWRRGLMEARDGSWFELLSPGCKHDMRSRSPTKHPEHGYVR